MEFVCPQCGTQGRIEGRVPGQQMQCLHCNHSWVATPTITPPTTTTARRRVARAPLATRAQRELEPWITGWAVGGALSLLVGVLLPLVISLGRRAETKTIWFWDMLEKSNGNLTLSILMPALLAIAALIVAGTARGRGRAMTLFLMAIGVVVLNVALAAGASFEGNRRVTRMMGVRQTANTVVVLALISCAVLAAGNHARKVHPSHIGPRLMAGLAGCLLALTFFLPIEDGHAVIEVFGIEEAREEGWPILIGLGVILVYAVLGMVHFGAYRQPGGLCTAVSIVVRLLLFGAPAAVLATFFLDSNTEHLGMAFMLATKAALMLYGILALVGVGLAGWVSHSVRGPSTALQEEIVRAFGAGAMPEPDLKSKLVRLKEARDEGLLTQEEYEAKRKDVIERSDY